jgi:hypothetical protein
MGAVGIVVVVVVVVMVVREGGCEGGGDVRGLRAMAEVDICVTLEGG